MKEKLKKLNVGWIKACVVVLMVAALVFIVYFVLMYFLPDFLPILEHGSEAEIEEYIRSFGSFKSVIFTAFLQFIQVVSIVFPGLPIQVAAGIIFGAFKGYLICHSSYILANLAVFVVVRKLGSKLSGLMPSEKKSSRFKALLDPNYPQFTVFFGCMMPLLPNGIVPYIAARTKISTKSFVISMAAGSFPTILLLCAIGNRILEGQFVFAAILLGVVLMLMLLCYIFKPRLVGFARKLREKWRSLRVACVDDE